MGHFVDLRWPACDIVRDKEVLDHFVAFPLHLSLLYDSICQRQSKVTLFLVENACLLLQVVDRKLQEKRDFLFVWAQK